MQVTCEKSCWKEKLNLEKLYFTYYSVSLLCVQSLSQISKGSKEFWWNTKCFRIDLCLSQSPVIICIICMIYTNVHNICSQYMALLYAHILKINQIYSLMYKRKITALENICRANLCRISLQKCAADQILPFCSATTPLCTWWQSLSHAQRQATPESNFSILGQVQALFSVSLLYCSSSVLSLHP